MQCRQMWQNSKGCTNDVVQQVRLAGGHARAAVQLHMRHMHVQVVVCAAQSCSNDIIKQYLSMMWSLLLHPAAAGVGTNMTQGLTTACAAPRACLAGHAWQILK